MPSIHSLGAWYSDSHDFPRPVRSRADVSTSRFRGSVTQKTSVIFSVNCRTAGRLPIASGLVSLCSSTLAFEVFGTQGDRAFQIFASAPNLSRDPTDRSERNQPISELIRKIESRPAACCGNSAIYKNRPDKAVTSSAPGAPATQPRATHPRR